MTLLGIYFFIGFVYVLINAGIRKLESTEDHFLVFFFWFLLWPIAAIAWLIILFKYAYKYALRELNKPV